MKQIRIEMEDGSKWDVPLNIVAENKANYYCESIAEFEREKTLVMNVESEGIDWLQNNMDWDDVKSVAVRVESEIPDYNKMMVNADMKIIDEE